ncbi:MAG: N-acetyltransferase [Bacteroidales bacterium]|nr:N-acetyltransferase [Bacteroidales bacterium]
MTYTIREVHTKSEFRQFYQFQNKLYKHCKVYVPTLDFDQKKTFSKSPALEYCRQKLLLAYDGKMVVGRVCAIINPRYNELYHTKRMRFGWIDFENDIEIAKLLLDAAQQWGKSEGMEEIHGPLGYNTMYKQGMVVEGFDSVPPVNCLYNFSYYPEFMEQLGFEKECDWIQYKLNATQGAPDKLKRMSKLLLERYNLKIVDVKELKKCRDLIHDFFYNFNRSFMSVHNFIPLTEHEIEEEGKMYISQLRSELTCFVMDDSDKIASFGICIPNMSPALQKAGGRLFPFGWYHLIRGRSHYNSIDLMMVGSDPAWNNKGLSAIFHTQLAHNFAERGIEYAITNPQIETNSAVKVWDSYPDREDYIRRRCYIKPIK